MWISDQVGVFLHDPDRAEALIVFAACSILRRSYEGRSERDTLRFGVCLGHRAKPLDMLTPARLPVDHGLAMDRLGEALVTVVYERRNRSVNLMLCWTGCRRQTGEACGTMRHGETQFTTRRLFDRWPCLDSRRHRRLRVALWSVSATAVCVGGRRLHSPVVDTAAHLLQTPRVE